mgnify:CR=1 FL=1
MVKNFIVMLVLLTPIFLIGCGSELAKVLGTDKMPPDEFTILTKPNLIIPPEYNLRPPAEERLGQCLNNQVENCRQYYLIIQIVQKILVSQRLI